MKIYLPLLALSLLSSCATTGTHVFDCAYIRHEYNHDLWHHEAIQANTIKDAIDYFRSVGNHQNFYCTNLTWDRDY